MPFRRVCSALKILLLFLNTTGPMKTNANTAKVKAAPMKNDDRENVPEEIAGGDDERA